VKPPAVACVASYVVEIGGQRQWEIGIDQVDAIWNLTAGLREIAAFKSADDGATAKGIGEFCFKGPE
jgi:hypothetical protein